MGGNEPPYFQPDYAPCPHCGAVGKKQQPPEKKKGKKMEQLEVNNG
jgi:hypothetical protein